MGTISIKRRIEFERNVKSSFSSNVRLHWGKFSSMQAYKWLENAISGEKGRLAHLKHNKVPDECFSKVYGYYEGKMSLIEERETQFVYKIFGKNYAVHNYTHTDKHKAKFKKYDDVFPREVWIHPDFNLLGHVVWTETEYTFYGWKLNDDLPKCPYMSFYKRNGIISFRIKIHENDRDILGSFPYLQEVEGYREIMKIAGNYNISIINIEEIQK